jgi:hypothetical protein
MRILLAAIAWAVLGQPALAAAAAKPIEVMVVGTWHFANHNRDIHNIKSADVLAAKRQQELERVSRALEAFHPTRVMDEQLATGPDLIDHKFERFSEAMLHSDPEEYVQIGYRVANDLGLKNVYAINEQPSAGEPDYFPYGKVQDYAEKHGQMAILDELSRAGAAATEAFDASQPRETIARLLMDVNSPSFFGGIGSYYPMLAIGDTEDQVGADLNAMWYLRNAKIFAKLMKVAQPGDRILIVFGAGHAYWLRHFASQVPGFTNVDPIPYLKRAAKRR